MRTHTRRQEIAFTLNVCTQTNTQVDLPTHTHTLPPTHTQAYARALR